MQKKQLKKKINAPRKSKAKAKPRGVRVLPVERKIRVPAAFATGSKTKAPQVRNADGKVLVKHTEYLMDIPGTTTFDLPENQVIIVQPGLVDSFAWLSQIASSYEMYRIVDLVYHYKARLPTSSGGQVYMAFQNDSADATFGSKLEMMGYCGSQDNSVWANQDFRVKIDEYMKRYFIRSNVLASGSDSQLYDVGMFSITAITSAAQTIAGELHVSYTVEFMKPKISSSVGAGYYARYSSLGSALSTLVAHPITTGFAVLDSQVPSALYYTVYPTTTSGIACDAILFPMMGVYLVTMDINYTTGTQTAALTTGGSYGASLTEIDIRDNDNLGGVAPNDCWTGYWIVNVTAGGSDIASGSANFLNLFFSGGTGIIAWNARTTIVQLMPGALGTEVGGVSHHRVFRRPVGRPGPTQFHGERKEHFDQFHESDFEPPPLSRQLRLVQEVKRSNTPERSSSQASRR